MFISKHHYAIELAKQNRVFFLNPPSSEFSLNATDYENLWVVNYIPLAKGLRFFPAFLQRYFMKLKFEKLQRLTGVHFDCVWSFDNSVFFDFSFLPKKVLKISHIVDYAQDFQFSKAAATADFCFGVSQNIVARLILYNKKSFLIPHGISPAQRNRDGIKLPGIGKIKAGYAGNLDSSYLDKDLLYSLTESHPEVDFIFLGSGGANWSKRPNVFLEGIIKQEELVSYLKRMDVLLIVYDTEKFPNQLTNSHKILEYLSSGIVVVSTFFSDYAKERHLLEMATSKEEFEKIFRKVTNNLEFYNNVESKKSRTEYASNNTYSMRLAEIEDKIKIFND